MKKSVESLLPEVWRAMWGNPIIFVPPAAVFLLNVMATAGFTALYLGSLMAYLRNLGDLFNHFAYGDWRGAFAGFTAYTLLMFCAYISFIALIGLLHSAGWGNMFARIAAAGSADIGDYFEGIARFTVRMGVGEFLKQCLHVISALCMAVLWAAMMLAFKGSGAAVTLCFILLVPAFIAFQGLIKFLLLMWRPACFIDNLDVVDSFAASLRFVRRHWSSLVVVFILWSAGAALMFGAFSLLTAAAQAVFTEMEKVSDAPFRAAASAGAGMIAWALGFGLTVFFTLYMFIFYRRRRLEEESL